MVDHEPAFDPRRQFSISPKASLSELGQTQREMKLQEPRMKIIQGMVQNVYEVSLVNPDTWFPLLRKKYPFGSKGEKIVSGVELLYKDISFRLGREMFRQRWELDSPEVVYVSGFYVVNNLQTSERELEERIRNINQIVFLEHPVRDFKSEALEKVKAELDPIQQVIEPIQEGFDLYAHVFFNGREDVLESLKRIADPLYANNNTSTSKKSN